MIEYRDHKYAPWKKSDMAWSTDEMRAINGLVGYEKYRLVA